MLTKEQVLLQSQNAMQQWENDWRANSSKNGDIYKASGTKLYDLLNKGVGKIGIVCAFGAGFERSMDILKKYRKRKDIEFDIICVDKCVKYMDDLKPDYVVIADAKVSYDWAKKFNSKDSVLLSNVNANPEWAQNWKGKTYFYVNKDNIESEKIFSKISGCQELIPASSNVGNTAVVIAATILNYDRIILVGYDFCWGQDDKYYAFCEHSDKRYWMAHRICIDNGGRMVSTSENLNFSSNWLSDFLEYLPIKNIYNSSKNSILRCHTLDLERQLRKARKRQLSQYEKNKILGQARRSIIVKNMDELNSAVAGKYITDIHVNFIPWEVMQWVNN